MSFERVIYEVGDYDRATVIEGTREEIIAELHDSSDGWFHFGKETLAFEARSAAAKILAGAGSVRVGHLEYVVKAPDGQS